MNILFISETLPINTYASEVVFYRHFLKLASDGHQIHIVTDQNSYNNRKKDIPAAFHVHLIPNRKWYYLPYKPYGILQKLRYFLYYFFYLRKILKKHKINRLIGYVNGNFLIAFCAYLQKKTKIPLLSFFHDDTNEINFGDDTKSVNDNTKKILDASSKIFVASIAFTKNWSIFSHKFILLYPIPSLEETQNEFSRSLINKRIGYSGTVYNEIIPSLDKFSSFLKELDFKFTIIGNNKNASYLGKKYFEVTCLPLFDTASEASKYLVANCRACLIAYPEMIHEMPWIRTCFPSKFIQYCLLDIPTIIVAPLDSALGEWCISNKWILYSNTYDIIKLNELLSNSLTNEAVVQQVKYFKEYVFNPKLIHEKFELALLN